MKKHLVVVLLCAMFYSATAAETGKKCNKGTENSSEGVSERLNFIYNPKTKVQAAVNETADAVPVLDYFHNISALYNGKTGAALAFNYETGIGVFVPPGSDVTWYSARKSFDKYFSNLPSQLELFEYGETHGIRFDPSTITEDISDKMVEILKSLSPEYNSQCDALGTYIHISKISGDYLKTSLVDINNVVGSVDTPLRGDLKWLVGIYQGIGSFFEVIPGGTSSLVKKNIKLSLGRILTEKSGFHVLTYLLKELKPYYDICKIFGSTLNCPVKFFTLVDKFGGELNYGFEGFVHVVREILSFYSNASSITNVKIGLQQYGNNPLTNRTEVAAKWNSNIQYFSQSINKLRLNNSLRHLTHVLADISHGNWTLNKVNMSQILNVVIEIDPSNSQELIKQAINLIQANATIFA